MPNDPKSTLGVQAQGPKTDPSSICSKLQNEPLSTISRTQGHLLHKPKNQVPGRHHIKLRQINIFYHLPL